MFYHYIPFFHTFSVQSLHSIKYSFRPTLHFILSLCSFITLHFDYTHFGFARKICRRYFLVFLFFILKYYFLKLYHSNLQSYGFHLSITFYFTSVFDAKHKCKSFYFFLLDFVLKLHFISSHFVFIHYIPINFITLQK
jgi:hypothetical protein